MWLVNGMYYLVGKGLCEQEDAYNVGSSAACIMTSLVTIAKKGVVVVEREYDRAERWVIWRLVV